MVFLYMQYMHFLNHRKTCNFVKFVCMSANEYRSFTYTIKLYIFFIQKHTVLIYKMTSKWMMIVFACPPAQIFLNAQKVIHFFKNTEEKREIKNRKLGLLYDDTFYPTKRQSYSDRCKAIQRLHYYSENKVLFTYI